MSAEAGGRREEGKERLARVVGRTRARVLAAVREPLTTEQVAQVVGTAISTTSAHLNALARDGLVTRRRERRLVYYELSDRGRSLIELLGDEYTV